MARPRVFISSTHTDLRHLRASLRTFLESLGCEPIISENGSITYHPNIALDVSCYKAVEDVDIFVLIIGNRYGSPASTERNANPSNPNDEYESITRGEYHAALSRQKPIFVLIDLAVLHEYETYLKNKNKTDIVFAHVETRNVFQFVEEVYSTKPVQPFSHFDEIAEWLREQFAGLFRDLLRQNSSTVKIDVLTQRVDELREVAATLKTFSEEIVKNVAKPDEHAKNFIESEERSLRDRLVQTHLLRVPIFFDYVNQKVLNIEDIVKELRTHSTLQDLLVAVNAEAKQRNPTNEIQRILSMYRIGPNELANCNNARSVLGLSPMTLFTKHDEKASPLS